MLDILGLTKDYTETFRIINSYTAATQLEDRFIKS
jgi:hypothetical protein